MQKLSLNNSKDIEIKKGGVTVILNSPLNKKKCSLVSVDIELITFLTLTNKKIKKTINSSLKRIFSRVVNITTSEKIHFEKDYLLEIVKEKGKLFTVVSDDFGNIAVFQGDLSANIAITMFSARHIIESVFNSQERETFFKNVKI